MNARTVFVLAIAVVLAAVSPFVAQPVDPTQPALPFDETKPTGLSDRVVSQAEESNLTVPKAEAYYSQYRYVVGYYGITSLVSGLQAQERREVGRVLTVFVSDYSGTNVSVGPDGFLRAPRAQGTGWVRARQAYFVVNSSARVPTRETAIVPFSARSDAVAFARKYGGAVRRWPAVRELSVGRAGRTVKTWKTEVDRRRTRAERDVDAARALLDRPVAVRVDNDTTVAAAIRAAPSNSTIVIPPGTYNVDDLRITKPVTLRGAGPNATHLVGDGNGTVVTTVAEGTAIVDLSITGVGPERAGNKTEPNVSVPEDSWKQRFYGVHAYGDAAIVFDDAGSSFVSNVRINTTSNGVLARTSPDVVVSNLTLYGTKRWQDGFLGVSTVGARVIVQDSRFYGSKVGVYAFDAPRVVVRNTTMEGMMVGVFDLFSPRLLASRNTIEDVWNGIYAETRSYGNAIVANTVRNSRNGIIIEGRSNFVARNTLLHNRHGMEVHGQYALYWRNTFAYNRVGAKSDALLPMNRVTANDFVGNRRYVATQQWNVRHVWAGNYWAGIPTVGSKDGRYLDREFRPTGPVDGRLATTAGTPTLARAPALQFVRQLQSLLPGLQSAGVVDPRPLARPARPELARVLDARHDTPGQHPDDDPWDYHD
jgi:nitrous oxidase accessory protein NosD/nitrous oxide reductase accessory protein NosL